MNENETIGISGTRQSRENRQKVRFGIIGLGLMGKEIASAIARWGHLLDDGPLPVITAICNQRSLADRDWFLRNFDTLNLVTTDYRELLASSEVDAVYCAVPHNLHEQIYVDILNAGKHLLGEKPFGIDLDSNRKIVDEVKGRDLVVRCSSEFPYYPGAKRLIDWLHSGASGRLIEVRCGFHHSSDMDLLKPINWKRKVETNGSYGCMGDLGFHVHHIPLRMGWVPEWIFADLSNIVTERVNSEGGKTACDTWDNATLIGRCLDPKNNRDFSIVFETKRMAPGQTNTWFIEVYGIEESARFSTHNPRSFYHLRTTGREQGWTRIDIGADFFIPTITGGILETGFSDALQQMLGAFVQEFRPGGSIHPFPNGSVEETRLSHKILTAALRSHETGARVPLSEV